MRPNKNKTLIVKSTFRKFKIPYTQNCRLSTQKLPPNFNATSHQQNNKTLGQMAKNKKIENNQCEKYAKLAKDIQLQN